LQVTAFGEFHRREASHSLSGTTGDTMSPVILPVWLNEPSQDAGFFGGGNRIGQQILLTLASRVRQAALNTAITFTTRA